ncbi:hypothetical protein RvVAT039_17730 [Agrobacterium vitis]|nr:hypothetical protein RvVAT039_17730 [Agrobacterium vitis]
MFSPSILHEIAYLFYDHLILHASALWLGMMQPEASRDLRAIEKRRPFCFENQDKIYDPA